MLKTLAKVISAVALAAPLVANATLFDFTATLKGSNEVPGNLRVCEKIRNSTFSPNRP